MVILEQAHIDSKDDIVPHIIVRYSGKKKRQATIILRCPVPQGKRIYL